MYIFICVFLVGIDTVLVDIEETDDFNSNTANVPRENEVSQPFLWVYHHVYHPCGHSGMENT